MKELVLMEFGKKLGFINGNGTTTETKSYSHADENLTAGKYQYRLKQIDFDGTFEYSNTIEVDINLPKTFALLNCFPNPFNPSTTITYRIPISGKVALKIFDVLGNEIVTLVSEEMTPGNYNVHFDASNLTSGVYLYRIQAGDYVQTRKMILIK